MILKPNRKELFIDRSVAIIGRTVLVFISVLPMVLFYHALPFLAENSMFDIFFSDWKPRQQIYGLRSFIYTTILISLLSALLAFVISSSLAVYIYFNRNRFTGSVILKSVRIMSGIPTVVYGLAGIMLIVPLIRDFTPSSSGLCLLSVIIVLSVLIVPTMTIYMINGLELVPSGLKTAGLSLGADDAQLFFKILLPAAKSSFVIALILGFTRAMSDTMIALMLSGNSFRFPVSLYQSARNATSQIALLIPGEFSGTEFKSIFLLALILMAIVVVLDFIIIRMEQSKREK